MVTLPSLCWSLIKQSNVVLGHVDSQAFSLSADDLDGVQFAAFDLVQNGLSRAPEPFRGVIER